MLTCREDTKLSWEERVLAIRVSKIKFLYEMNALYWTNHYFLTLSLENMQ